MAFLASCKAQFVVSEGECFVKEVRRMQLVYQIDDWRVSI